MYLLASGDGEVEASLHAYPGSQVVHITEPLNEYVPAGHGIGSKYKNKNTANKILINH